MYDWKGSSLWTSKLVTKVTSYFALLRYERHLGSRLKPNFSKISQILHCFSLQNHQYSGKYSPMKEYNLHNDVIYGWKLCQYYFQNWPHFDLWPPICHIVLPPSEQSFASWLRWQNLKIWKYKMARFQPDPEVSWWFPESREVILTNCGEKPMGRQQLSTAPPVEFIQF